MMENSSDKPDTGTWNSVDDVLKSLYSMSRVTKGAAPKSDSGLMTDQFAGNSKIENCPETSQNASTSDEGIIDETTSFGSGRGKLLKDLHKQFSRQQLDETIHNELRMIFGPGFSNEVIENHFDSVCSSSNKPSTQETTRVFSNHYSEENHQNIEFDVGESNIMKKITAHEKYSARKKKSPRCRNAVVLSLIEKKNSNETEQYTKKVPELKGPDVFLANKSYSTVASAASTSSNHQADEPVFNDEDFPAL